MILSGEQIVVTRNGVTRRLLRLRALCSKIRRLFTPTKEKTRQ
jgi:hypothetical protein